MLKKCTDHLLLFIDIYLIKSVDNIPLFPDFDRCYTGLRYPPLREYITWYFEFLTDKVYHLVIHDVYLYSVRLCTGL